jgi:hypothetical protein
MWVEFVSVLLAELAAVRRLFHGAFDIWRHKLLRTHNTPGSRLFN